MKLNFKIDERELIQAFDKYMDDIIDFIFQRSQEHIVRKGIVDEGTLLKTGNVNRKLLDKEIVYPVPYADSIEFGRLPGSMPPVESIKGWVRRKLGIRDEKEINRIAWVISNDIKKNGMEPRPFLGPAIEEAKHKYGKH